MCFEPNYNSEIELAPQLSDASNAQGGGMSYTPSDTTQAQIEAQHNSYMICFARMESYSDDRETSWVYSVEYPHLLYDFITPFSIRSLCQLCQLVVEMPGLKSLDLSSNKVSPKTAHTQNRERGRKK